MNTVTTVLLKGINSCVQEQEVKLWLG